ncbi:MAG: hypothetical protein J4G01_00035 [Dehalococcoidia bacterium]|nr:hypothetical protein [Dehalococcoidia bacterium]
MRLYWRERRAGQRLVLLDDFDAEIEVGAVRQTRRGFDALAKTNTYDPGRAQKGFATLEEAKEFVEWFHPWDIFGGDLDMTVESEVQPDLSASDSPAEAEADSDGGTPDPAATEAGDSGPAIEERDPAAGAGQTSPGLAVLEEVA